MEDISICIMVFLPPPGSLTVVLALLAAIATMPKIIAWLEKPAVRRITITLFCLIAAGEIAIIQHAVRVSEERFRTSENNFRLLVTRSDEQKNLIAALNDSMGNLATLRTPPVPISAPAKVTIKPYVVPSLKQRAFELSAAILQHLASREFFARTPAPNSQSFEHDANMWVAYDRETVEEYRQQFEPAVRKIRDEFAAQRLTDRYLQGFTNRDPVNTTGVRMIAVGIGDLAKQLKD